MSEEQKQSSSPTSKGFSAFWAELKRRHVVRVGIVYAIVGWLVIQVANATFEEFGIPLWAYRFVVLMVVLGFPISVVLAWAFELTPEGIKTTKAAQKESPPPTEFSRKRKWMTFAFGAAVPTLIFGTLAIVFYFQAKPAGDSQEPLTNTPITQSTDKSIAVLPLTNMSPEAENAFFADGVQEDILTNLSKIKDLIVISRSSTLQYRNVERNLKQVADELGVNYLVEGSVRRAGDQVRVTVQLIDARSDEHVWAENYDRKLDDIFAIQTAISREIAGQLQAALSPEELTRIERRPTENQEAYDYYQRGRQRFGSESTLYMEKAVALDPGFAEAWAEMASDYIADWNNDLRRDPELLQKAYQALQQAKRLGPDLPETHLAENMFSRQKDYNFQESIDHLLKALAINPGFFPAQRQLASRYAQIGRLAEAQLHFEAVLRLEPNYGSAVYQLTTVYIRRKMWEKAIEHLQSYSDTMPGPGQRHSKAQLQYFQEGDKRVLLQDQFSLEEMPARGPLRMWDAKHAVISRDLQAALKHVEATELGYEFVLLGSIGETPFQFAPFPLLRTLLWFELEDEQQWIVAAEEACSHLERLLKDYPEGDPRYRSNLVICHALQGEREPIDALVTNLREQTRTPNWQYARQQQCEMHIAIAYLILGDQEKAIETLEAANKIDGPIYLARELDLWFIFDRLRGDPRFDALLKD